MFIKQVSIENYKCLSNESGAIDLGVPDGKNPGSGLTILVGENGTGKTSVLEAIHFLMESPYNTQNRINIRDFCDPSQKIKITASMSNQFKYKMPENYRGQFFYASGVQFEAKVRDLKSKGKFLSPPLTASCKVISDNIKYRNEEGKESDKSIEDYHKSFEDSRLEDDISVFYFDKSRSRQIAKGTYKTTFERITDDLNWKFYKSIKDNPELKVEFLGRIAGDYFNRVVETTQKGLGVKISEEIRSFFQRDGLAKIRIELMHLLWPFSDSFFAVREDDDMLQIPIHKLGSGIEMIFTLLLLRSISSRAKGSIVYLIDEPEMNLHPQAQTQLFNLLLEESKSEQIVVSTHSPYFTDPLFIENLIRFRVTGKNKVQFNKLSAFNFKADIKENRNFFFRHRDLFFAKAAIFVEGVDDHERYLKFFDLNGFGNLSNYLFMMNGCDSTLFFEDFCEKYGVSFCAIVDKDFSIERSKWSRGNRQRLLKDVKKFVKEKAISFDESKFDEEMAKELSERPRTGEREAEKIKVGRTHIHKVKGKNVFVLMDGEVKDYLNADGTVVEENRDGKFKELKAIFTQIKVLLKV